MRTISARHVREMPRVTATNSNICTTLYEFCSTRSRHCSQFWRVVLYPLVDLSPSQPLSPSSLLGAARALLDFPIFPSLSIFSIFLPSPSSHPSSPSSPPLLTPLPLHFLLPPRHLPSLLPCLPLIMTPIVLYLYFDIGSIH